MTAVRFNLDVAGFNLLSSLPILHRLEDLGAFRRALARADYASGLMAAKKLAKPVTGTRGRGPIQICTALKTAETSLLAVEASVRMKPSHSPQWIDLVDSLDQPHPRGNRTRARGAIGGPMSVDSRPIDRYSFRAGPRPGPYASLAMRVPAAITYEVLAFVRQNSSWEQPTTVARKLGRRRKVNSRLRLLPGFVCPRL